MNGILSRLNAVFAFGMWVCTGMTFLTFLVTVGIDMTRPHDLAIHDAKVTLTRDPHGPNIKQDLASFHFDLEVDLTPLFHWNNKQLFLYILAEYETPQNDINQTVESMESGKKAAGFVTDFDFLIHRIKDEGEDRAGTYSTFTHMWQDLEMYKIFDGRTSESDKADFIDACYSCVVQFLVLKDADHLVRSTCIYMLLALYTTQTNKTKRGIRMTPAQYKILYEFAMESFHEYGLRDTYAVFWQLHHLGAFEFPTTHTQKLLGTSDVWQHAINSDEVSPALLNVVDEISGDFDESLSFAVQNLRMTFDAYKATIQRVHECTPPDADMIYYKCVNNPADIVDRTRQRIIDRARETERIIAGVPSLDDENSIYNRRQRIRHAAQTSRVARCAVATIDRPEDEQVSPSKEERKIVVRKHQTVETFNQKHLVEKQSFFPKGNKSIYPSKDLVEIANSTKIKRGRPFVVDVESRVIQKGQVGQWHVRKDKLRAESESEAETLIYVFSNVYPRKRDKVQTEMERETRLEELEQERKELEAAREQGVDKKIIEQKEKEFRKREKVIQMMGEDEEPKFVGRPRKDDPKREEMRKPGPKSELQKKRKLEQDLKKFEEKQIIKEQKRRAKEIEREEKKRAMKAAREAEKAAKEAKSPPKKKRKVKTDEEKRKEKRLSEEKKKIKQEANEKAKAEKAAKPKYQAHLDFDNLKAGDFFETDDPENSSPQLVKISFVDKSSESVRGMYWDIEPGEVGMALYERTWKPSKEYDCEILFCSEDFAQKVYMRKVMPGAHPAAGMKLTAKSADHIKQRWPKLKG
ncbi:Oidioi.mRNA.OKI2018_I69.chr1.g3236.t1.cds [Oikopleura dioica]|uniref:Oidioi.mRNA.OKI2018_I69.chr1.g3236.t1.cds n=1 Tax=Oikopleura dioica TaxID=34765 RepID=A0ABN7SXF3_OIKDI|nr:Oidioi.mRNA.OKI2018_I69.chr1.g3236.t1.cds [Oikopleura dioica]